MQLLNINECRAVLGMKKRMDAHRWRLHSCDANSKERGVECSSIGWMWFNKLFDECSRNVVLAVEFENAKIEQLV